MYLLYSVLFGAGVAAFAYSRVGRRVGYGNTQSVAIAIGAIFVIAAVFFYSVMVLFIH